MTPLELLGWLWIVMFLGYFFRPPQPRARMTKFRGPPGPRPVTPEPTYICTNCGMLIHTGHGHTREECEDYDKARLALDRPDHRIRHVLEGSNDPRIRKPRYLKSGTFSNWGAGEVET